MTPIPNPGHRATGAALAPSTSLLPSAQLLPSASGDPGYRPLVIVGHRD